MSYKSVAEGELSCGAAPHAVLVVSDEQEIRESICALLVQYYRVEVSSGGEEALHALARQPFDCVLIDMNVKGGDTLVTVRRIRELGEGTQALPVALLCSAAEISAAVEGIRAGATDFIIKEVEFVNLPERIAKLTGLRAKTLKGLPDPACQCQMMSPPSRMIVGRSARMLKVIEVAKRAASFPVTILLLGESGTGKGFFAQWIHQMSHRAEGPFVGVNLAAIPSELMESTLFGHEKGAFTGAVHQRTGKFTQAENGTLLLDEITELRLELQPKLLRVLQECEFERVGGDRTLRNEARVIAATNRDIAALVEDGAFRNDLYHRLNVITLTLPALRDRREDIPDLARLFFAKYNRLYSRQLRGITAPAMDALMDHLWPGNIRELEHVVQRAVIVSDSDYIDEEDLFDNAVKTPNVVVSEVANRKGTLEDLEQQYITEILQRTGGHQGNAARILGIDRKTLYNKIMKYGLRQSLEQCQEESTA